MTMKAPSTTLDQPANTAPALNFGDVLRAIRAAERDGLPVRELLNAAMGPVGGVERRYLLADGRYERGRSPARDRAHLEAATAALAHDAAAAQRHGLSLLERPTEHNTDRYDEYEGRVTAVRELTF